MGHINPRIAPADNGSAEYDAAQSKKAILLEKPGDDVGAEAVSHHRKVAAAIVELNSLELLVHLANDRTSRPDWKEKANNIEVSVPDGFNNGPGLSLEDRFDKLCPRSLSSNPMNDCNDVPWARSHRVRATRP